MLCLILQDLGPLVGLKHEAEDDLEKIKLRIIKAPKVCIFYSYMISR